MKTFQPGEAQGFPAGQRWGAGGIESGVAKQSSALCWLSSLLPCRPPTSTQSHKRCLGPENPVRNLLMVENQVPKDHQQVRGNFFFFAGGIAGVSVGRERKLLCSSHQTEQESGFGKRMDLLPLS